MVTTCHSVSIRLLLNISKNRKCDQNMDEKPFFLRQQFSDFEAYCESARHWDLDYNQLDCGDFTSERLMFGSATTIFSHTKIERRMLQRGATPTGLITFGILANPNINIHWRSYDICGDKLFIFPPGGEPVSYTHLRAHEAENCTASPSLISMYSLCHYPKKHSTKHVILSNYRISVNWSMVTRYLTATHRACCC